jgi:UDP-N-acetylmuramoyl-L-alanyl-D-glutamate--2,6-diaminopimelate ligase
MGKVATKLSDYVIITSDNPRDENPKTIISEIKKGINTKNYEVIVNREKAIKRVMRLAKPLDIVLIAGKGHEEYQIVGNKKIHFSDKNVALRAVKS